MKKEYIVLLFVVFVVTFFGSYVYMQSQLDNDKETNNTVINNNTVVENKTVENKTTGDNKYENESFDYKVIKKANEGNSSNILVSPLSIGYALSMVRDGADGKTLSEINSILGDYKLSKVTNVEKNIGLANGLFINKSREKEVSKDYINNLKKDYAAEVIFDPFNGPEVVNNWVNDKTCGMIKRTLNTLDPSYLLVLANTVAIDVEWGVKFEAESTRSEKFTLLNGTTMDSAMMHASNTVSYIKSDNAQGIVKSYRTYGDNDLEYIAILPNGDIKEYINNFNGEELNKLLSNIRVRDDKTDIVLSLPKYTYDYDYRRFKSDLISLGMGTAFDMDNANFSKIGKDVYIDEAVHKTHIELSENGTKAAAVTAVAFKANSVFVPEEKEKIIIEFNKPFVYLIKDKKNDNIWFFGVVYEPMKWEDNKKAQ